MAHNPDSLFSEETLSAAGFPTISYDVLAVGTDMRSDERHLRPEDTEAYAWAVEDEDPWFFGPSPFGGAVCHPTLLANQALLLRHNRFVVPAGLHARMVFRFHKAIPLGARIRTTGQVVDKYWRRDKPYMVTAFETRGDDGTLYTSGRFVQMLFAKDTAPASGSSAGSNRAGDAAPAYDDSIASAQGRDGVLERGQALPALSRTIVQRQIDIYSGIRPFSIHTDEDWARRKGFAATIAQGMMSTAYISTMLQRAVGAGFVEGGTMDAKFLKPVLCGDTLEVTGTVAGFTRDEDGRVRAHVTVAAHNQRGEQTMAGSASGVCAP
ncbi:MAG: MaoC family dehydratase [Alphaproteobacteria bacterium]|nr:MaoC family dehydratase [Alphaproteobacteria bacterium]MCB9929096.1 MaoC family dehydratase [Alphaproteobacteria bacterium]